MPAENHEWLKILVSALAGVFTGLAADPIRAAIQTRIDRARMKTAVAVDLSDLSSRAKSVEDGRLSAAMFWKTVELPAFDYYWERNRQLFHLDPKSRLLRSDCEMVKHMKGRVEDGREHPEDGWRKLLEGTDVTAWAAKTDRADAIRRFITFSREVIDSAVLGTNHFANRLIFSRPFLRKSQK